MSEFRIFLQSLIKTFLPKPKKKKRLPKPIANKLKIGYDEYLEDGKPVREKGYRR